MRGSKFGTQNRFFSGKQIVNPGPGAYKNEDVKQLNLKYLNSTSFGFGRDKKNYDDQSFSPGPGNQKYQSKIVESPNYSFGIKITPEYAKPKKDLPGPGSHDHDIRKAELVKYNNSYNFSFRPRIQEKNQLVLQPGPGRYNHNSSLRNNKIVIGTEAKLKEIKKLAIGPGDQRQDQNSIKHASPDFSFGKETRMKSRKTDAVPGPGSYTESNFFKTGQLESYEKR